MVIGVAALILTLLIDHQTVMFKVVSYKLHLIVDFLVGVTFVAVSFILGFQGIDLVFFLVKGEVLLVVGLHKSEDELTPVSIVK